MSTDVPGVSFVIGGVQKGGTSALARYLADHPAIELPQGKEAHVFDSPAFDDAWNVADVDRCYAEHFMADRAAVLRGDATPLYLFHPRLIERIARYNPGMRWIVLLRDPVERAISHYYMEAARNAEHLPLPLALLAERRRLAGHESDFTHDSPLRTYSYRARGDYARQLDALYQSFPQGQVLVLRSDNLRTQPATTVARALDFLRLDPRESRRTEYPPVFAGDYHGRLMPALVRPWLRWAMRPERKALRDRYGIEF